MDHPHEAVVDYRLPLVVSVMDGLSLVTFLSAKLHLSLGLHLLWRSILSVPSDCDSGCSYSGAWRASLIAAADQIVVQNC